MGLFRRDRPVYFEPHGYRRKRGWSVPRWLLILLVGVVLGAAGLLYLQRLGPQRLTPHESRLLQARAEELERENRRLQATLDATSRNLQAARTEAEKLAAEAGAARQTARRLESELALIERVLPPDPRGGTVGVRAARFGAEPGRLNFQVLLTRASSSSAPSKAVIEIVVLGQRGSGREESITLDPVAVAFEGTLIVAQGSPPLPEAFAARQATIRVFDRPGGTLLGMRVFNLR